VNVPIAPLFQVDHHRRRVTDAATVAVNMPTVTIKRDSGYDHRRGVGEPHRWAKTGASRRTDFRVCYGQ